MQAINSTTNLLPPQSTPNATKLFQHSATYYTHCAPHNLPWRLPPASLYRHHLPVQLFYLGRNRMIHPLWHDQLVLVLQTLVLVVGRLSHWVSAYRWANWRDEYDDATNELGKVGNNRNLNDGYSQLTSVNIMRDAWKCAWKWTLFSDFVRVLDNRFNIVTFGRQLVSTFMVLSIGWVSNNDLSFLSADAATLMFMEKSLLGARYIIIFYWDIMDSS